MVGQLSCKRTCKAAIVAEPSLTPAFPFADGYIDFFS